METKDYGRYTLLKKLATGGMAEVFLARQKGLEGFEKLLVIKRILPHLADDQEFVEMFLNEARIAARFNHPNIVQIFDLGREQDTYFIAMEYIHGEDLGRIMRKAWQTGTWIPVPTALRIVANACEGLYYAHSKTDEHGNPLNVVHRDISPQNIIVSFDGGVKVVDFGIARASNQVSTTRSGAIKGKFAYMSPEQASGKVVDHRSDIFAIGLVLFELLTGMRPLKRENEIMTLKAAVDCVLPRPSEVAQVPAELDPVVLKSLARVADDRYPDARAFQLAIEDFLVTNRWPASTVHISEMMRQLFSDRLSEEARLGEPVVSRSETAGTPVAPVEPSENTLLPRLPTKSGRSNGLADNPVPRAVYESPPPPARSNPVTSDLLPSPVGFDEEWNAPPAQVAVAPAAPPRRTTGIRAAAAAPPAPAEPPPRRQSSASVRIAQPDPARQGERAAEQPRRRTTGEQQVMPPVRRNSAPGVEAKRRAPSEARRRSLLYMSDEEVAEEKRHAEEQREARDSDRPTHPMATRGRARSGGGLGGVISALVLLILGLGVAAFFLKPELRERAEAFVEKLREQPGAATADPADPLVALLNLESNVPVEVFLGAQKLGTSPLKGARIPAGRLALKLVNPNLGIERTVTVSAEEGGTTVHRESFAVGRVRFVAEKECEVFINGRRIARIPGPPLDFFEGSYDVECRNEPLRLVDRAKVRIPRDSGRVVEVHFKLHRM